MKKDLREFQERLAGLAEGIAWRIIMARKSRREDPILEFQQKSVQAEIYIDQENQIVHVFDLDLGGVTVNSAMCEAFQEEILGYWKSGVIDRSEIDQWIWYCYGPDGIIAEYQDGNFIRPIAADNLYAHPPFASKMYDRRKKY
jgi:hypothetical protein